jgi:alpha-tubulin suppressor-like RCC1 family protein
MYAHP